MRSTASWTRCAAGPGSPPEHGDLSGRSSGERCAGRRIRFDSGGAADIALSGCPTTGRETLTGARPFLENSTACQKSVPKNPVIGVLAMSSDPACAPVRIPLVMMEDSYERLAHCQHLTQVLRQKACALLCR